MFWFKPKSIVIDAFTIHRAVYELYKPENSIKFFPEEIKSIPNYYDDIDVHTKITKKSSTIRKCVGLIDYYKTGFILPMWTDFICQPQTAMHKETALALIPLPFEYNSHDRKQFSGIFEEYFHVKLSSPWFFKDTTGTKFSWNSASWNLHKHMNNFTIPPAVISFEHQSQTNVNMFINKYSDNFTLYAGTPLVHLTAISDSKVIIKHHLVDEKEILKIGIPNDFSDITSERYNKWVKQSSKNKIKCPFGFGK